MKAARYIQLLDDARCDEGWDQVPELVRKVRKHAPNRICTLPYIPPPPLPPRDMTCLLQAKPRD